MTTPMDIDLRFGDWRDVLSIVSQVDAVITDPPYGARTHDGSSERIASMGRAELDYEAWTPDDVREFVASWAPRCTGWFAAMTSDDLIPVWRAAYAEAGRYDFAPVPVLQHRPRLSGDGPGSCAVYLMVSRPREARFMSWGSLPGWYTDTVDRGGVIGGKPLRLMRALVRDYTHRGDMVCDPCAGGATTLLAATELDRRAIGAEIDIGTFRKAQRRIAAGFTPDMFPDAAGAEGR